MRADQSSSAVRRTNKIFCVTMTTVRDKTAIVTGGARGIGFHCCRQLLLNGAKAVAIFDLPSSDGKKTAESLNKEFGKNRAFFFPSDVTKFDEFEDVFKEATTALEGLDIFINNAGILNERIWKKMIDVNFTAVVNSTLVAYEYMGKHNGGKGGIVVNICSTAGLNSSCGGAPIYAGTKHAVLAFTCSLKESYKATGISVRVLCPSFTDTDLLDERGNCFLNFINKDTANVRLKTAQVLQPAEYVGKAVIEAIEKGENGSVWLSQLSEPPLEVKLHKYDCLRYQLKEQ